MFVPKAEEYSGHELYTLVISLLLKVGMKCIPSKLDFYTSIYTWSGNMLVTGTAAENKYFSFISYRITQSI